MAKRDCRLIYNNRSHDNICAITDDENMYDLYN